MMKELHYFDGLEIKSIVQDNTNVIHLEIDKSLKVAFVGYMDGGVDMICSSYLELKTAPVIGQYNKKIRSVYK